MRARLLLLASLVPACSIDKNPPAAADAAVEAPLIAPVGEMVREIDVSEAVADRLIEGTQKAFCDALRNRSKEALLAVLAEDFRGTFVGEAGEGASTGAIRVSRWPQDSLRLDRSAFADRVLAHAGAFAAIERCKLKPFELEVAEPGRDRGVATLRFQLAGPSGGKLTDQRGSVEAEVVLRGGKWLLRRAVTSALTEVRGEGGGFRDVSAQAGIHMVRSAIGEESVSARIDDRTLQTIGGVGVIDWEGDGFPDLFAWNRLRRFVLFKNDGRGGFRPVEDLLRPRDVGLFHLWTDLDGDGKEELISTEVVGCKNGKAWFAIWKRKGEALAPAGRLAFEQPCGGYQMLQYMHIAAGDLDRDGRLDLFLAGYSNRGSKGTRHNLYRASDGQRDLLFINHGKLDFTEESRARGIDDVAFGYSGELYDFDDDGDLDIYAVNDYGPNNLWLNDGSGKLTAAKDTPLVGNGQSMGITIADLDRDQDLDVYVSNMYSSAGNRIIPLVAGQVSKSTYQELLQLAQGNTLFAKVGPGRYEERARELGIANAEWAWGQSAEDFDGDGARDVFVTNGMTSNATLKEPDF